MTHRMKEKCHPQQIFVRCLEEASSHFDHWLKMIGRSLLIAHRPREPLLTVNGCMAIPKGYSKLSGLLGHLPVGARGDLEVAVVWCFTACSPSSGAAFAQHPREHGHAQGIVVAIGLKMDRKDFGSNPHVTLWVGIGF